jgi:hypothetical protein
MTRYRPDRIPHVPAVIAAIALTVAMLAGVHAEAEPQQCTAAVATHSAGPTPSRS